MVTAETPTDNAERRKPKPNPVPAGEVSEANNPHNSAEFLREPDGVFEHGQHSTAATHHIPTTVSNFFLVSRQVQH